MTTERAHASMNATPTVAHPPEIAFVCISLRTSVERREFMRAQFASMSLPVTFFDGIEPEERDYQNATDYDAAFREHYCGRQLSRGEVGCYRSHLAVWQALADSGDPAVCVIEDDVLLAQGFADTVNRLMAGPDDWDLVRLGGVFQRRSLAMRQVAPGVQLCDMAQPPRGTQAYLLRRSAVTQLSAHCRQIRYPIDDAIDRFWEHGKRLRAVQPWQAVEDQRLPTTIAGRTRPAMAVRVKLRRERLRLRDDVLRLTNFLLRQLNALVVRMIGRTKQ